MAENPYGFDNDTKSEEQDSQYMAPGLVENTEMVEIEFYPAEGDSGAYLGVEETDAEEKKINKRFYEPRMGSYVKTDADLKKAVIKFNKVLANLARKFLGEQYTMQGASFQEVCEKVITDIGNKYVGVKLRTKVILNTNNFPTLPGYAPIWELMTVPLKDTKLGITSYDKVVPDLSTNADTDSPGNAVAPKAWS